jgi:hypothetical protein
VRVLYKGEVTGKTVRFERDCICNWLLLFYYYWSGKRGMAPKGFRWVRPFGVKPSPRSRLPLRRQDEVLKTLTDHLLDSFLIVGPYKTGKTVFILMLFHEALYAWANQCFKEGLSTEAVWLVTASDLADQYLLYETGRERQHQVAFDPETTVVPPEPVVTPRKIKAAAAAGLTPRVFIEEIDKINMTDARRRWLFSIINAVYENNGTLVATSNMPVEALLQHFGEYHAGAFIRRFTDNDGADLTAPTHGHLLNLFGPWTETERCGKESK